MKELERAKQITKLRAENAKDRILVEEFGGRKPKGEGC